MHPVIRQFISTDRSLGDVAAEGTAADAPVAQALRLLDAYRCGDDTATGGFQAARSVSIERLDPDLCALFLATWALAELVPGDAAEAGRTGTRMLVDRAGALVSGATPPAVRAHVRLAEACLKGAEGDRRAEVDGLRAALDAVPAEAPRRPMFVAALAAVLAEQGRLDAFEEELERWPAAGDGEAARLAVYRFVNQVETGRVDDAARTLPLLRDAPATDRFAARALPRYRVLLRLMQERPAVLDDGNHDAPPGDPAAWPDWALTLRCLLTGRVHQALRWARLCERRQPRCILDADCTAFNLLRAELAERNAPAARRLLEQRQARNNTHWLDDFFLARLALAEQQREAATAHYAVALKAADQRHAGGRLDFELLLAPEIPRDLLVRMTRAAERKRPSAARVRRPRRDGGPSAPGEVPRARLLGVSRAMQEVRSAVARFASLDVPVLITGETGTGKELAARALHEKGKRQAAPFLAVNCGAISETLLESELFGHAKGAFSGAGAARRGLFEEAGEGTILLDEIGDITPRLQLALLRVLETGDVRAVGDTGTRKVRCRILASTNANLDDLIGRGRFRRDLYYRLRRLAVHIPPLRARPEDVLPLAVHFLNEGRPADSPASLDPGLVERLTLLPWPGNVRELRNTIERMRLMHADKCHYDADDFEPPAQPVARTAGPTAAASRTAADGREERAAPLRRGRAAMRRRDVLRDLFRRHGRLTRAEVAATLNIAPNTATRDLAALCKEGFVRRIAPSKSPRSVYFERRET